MKEYILKYKQCDTLKQNIHPSWCELCEKQTKNEVINILKKHLCEPGEYTLHFYISSGPVYKHQSSAHGCLTRKDNKILEGSISVGSVDFDYSDDTFDNYDFKNAWPEINCEKELLNSTAQFVVARENLTSPKEYEIICERAAERFMQRLHKSVSFPLEIACDYPDVIFEICYDCKPEQNLIASTLKVIEDCVAKYNKRHDDGIHYVCEVSDKIDNKKPNAVYIHIDFGDCDITALALVIKAIGKSKLPIKELILR